MAKTKSPYAKRKVSTQDDDIALIGVCVKHPESGLQVIQWRDLFYYMDSGAVKKWVENGRVYFFPDKAHAFDVRNIDVPIS
jgi:hypothetical protein